MIKRLSNNALKLILNGVGIPVRFLNERSGVDGVVLPEMLVISLVQLVVD